jgi:hypothetical protein
MRRLAVALSWPFAVCVAFAVPLVPRDGLRFHTGWEKAIDPDGDCRFVYDKESLTIELPAKEHDLDPDRGRTNAPRLLREVEGDFVLQVRLGGDFKPSARSTAGDRAAIVAAGLLLTAGDTTFLATYAVEGGREERPHGSVRMIDASRHLHVNGDQDRRGPAWTLTGDGGPVYLRLQRRGDEFLASLGPDGVRWTDLLRVITKLPAKVKIGLAACTTSTDPFKPRFDQLRLTNEKKRD